MDYRPLPLRDQIDIILEEYRALYALLQWRLTAADRRLLVVGSLLAAALTALRAVEAQSGRLLLWGMPITLWAIVTATVGHNRSKEDLLRRLDEIERRVNSLAGTELLTFQSRHPGRGMAGGRTGSAAVNATLALAIALLVFACSIFRSITGDSSFDLAAFAAYCLLWAYLMLRAAWELQGYGYGRRSIVQPRDQR